MFEEMITGESEIPIGGLLTIDELDKFQYVRSEFTTPMFKAKITFEYTSMRFNASCVRLFPDSDHIQLLADPNKKRLLAWACAPHDKDSLRWSILKDGKPQTRYIRARMLCAKVYKMMEWNIKHWYKVMAVYQELNDVKFIVFNLEECEMYVLDESQAPTRNTRIKRKRIFPVDWENSFGTPYAEHKSTYETDINTLHLLSNTQEEDSLHKGEITPRVPTSSEIITREYYTPDEIEKGGGSK